ncbi:glycosyltransferase family A protein [Ammoniphilus sp. YIM 78166]|uniref:glycosyltransferase family 2 protein n=1 Tax=Ammoniphilus sp. YIM 78166 TaxID=1644106 RepID=UPI001431DEC1|nr:glycosyltransferase family A protein [Ammoniphilus sp. YIM 78166]
MQQRKVTVVIPVYNREKYISKAIESVQEQSFEKWEMLIMNDGSTDNTEQVIQNYLLDKRIRSISSPINQGVGKSLNLALQLIDTPYFTVVDSDDWIEKDTLSILLKEMENQPLSTSLVCANALVWRESLDGELILTHREIHRPFRDKYDFLFYGPMLSPRFFRTDSVRKVNGFESDDPLGGRLNEDRYLLLKLIAQSNFHYVNEDLYNILKHSGNLTKEDNRKVQNETKKYIVNKLLKEWGDEFEPVFYSTEEGWLDVKELVPKGGRN